MKIDLSDGVFIRNIDMDLEASNGNYVPVSLDMIITRLQAVELLALLSGMINNPKKGTRVVIKC